MDRRVKFDANNHFRTITQLHGSVWPAVLPFCALNCVNLLIAAVLKKYLISDLKISEDDFTSSLSIIVAFLSVTRVNISFNDYISHRNGLQQIARSARDLVFHSVAFTRGDSSTSAKEWRFTIARETIALLKLMVSALQFESKGEEAWKSSALTADERSVLLHNVGSDNERSSYVLTMFLQSTISSQDQKLNKPLSDVMILKLFAFVSDYTKGYNDIFALLDTGFPFPLIQMCRTFVFLYVFAMPWIMYLGEGSSIGLFPLMIYNFFVTYAFLGLEFVSLEMDDPYGDDPNDLEIGSLAEKVFEDIIMCIEDVDGEEKANILRNYCKFMEDVEECAMDEETPLTKFDVSSFKSPIKEKRSFLLKKASTKRLSTNGYGI